MYPTFACPYYASVENPRWNRKTWRKCGKSLKLALSCVTILPQLQMPACTQETLKYAHASVRSCNYLDSITLRRSRKFMQRQPTSCGVSDVRTNNNAAAHCSVCINFINKEKFPSFSNFASDFSCALRSMCLARYSKTKAQDQPRTRYCNTGHQPGKIKGKHTGVIALFEQLIGLVSLLGCSANIGPLKGVSCARPKYSFTNQS